MKKILTTQPQIILIALLCLAAAPTTSTSSKFLRFVEDDHGGGVLQASTITYRNSAGVSVDLIAAVHVADASFFHDLNKSFEQYDSLLYEMVKPEGADPSQPRDPNGTHALSWVTMLQHFLQQTLSLSFQLDEIDYSRKNFVHADLSLEQFQQMQQARGESMMTIMLQQMIREMSQENPNTPQPDLSALLLALQSPDRPRQLKLLLAREFEQIDEMTAGMDGPNGSVIIGERNKAAIGVLKKRIAAGDHKIGIFYGAAHLKGMEKILTEQMGFHPIGEPKWRTAWNLTRPTTQP